MVETRCGAQNPIYARPRCQVWSAGSTSLSCGLLHRQPWLQRVDSCKKPNAAVAGQRPTHFSPKQDTGQAVLASQLPAVLAKALLHLYHTLNFPSAQSFLPFCSLKHILHLTSISVSGAKEPNNDNQFLSIFTL